jgi:hypothetical protein
MATCSQVQRRETVTTFASGKYLSHQVGADRVGKVFQAQVPEEPKIEAGVVGYQDLAAKQLHKGTGIVIEAVQGHGVFRAQSQQPNLGLARIQSGRFQV